MPPEIPFLSYARNHEDVVLWRALAHLPAGRYVEVGAHHPTSSLTRAFHDRGWSGITLDDALAQRGGPDGDVHFMVIDAEGSESHVLAGVDLRTFRPWILVIAATAPSSTVQTHGTWEPAVLAAGYRFCFFDGMSRFYVAEEHAETIQPRLAYPACGLDDFVEAKTYAERQGRQELIEDVRRWRAEAITSWAGTGDTTSSSDLQRARRELAAVAGDLAAVRSTLSWRVTRPIRALRGLVGRR